MQVKMYICDSIVSTDGPESAINDGDSKQQKTAFQNQSRFKWKRKSI